MYTNATYQPSDLPTPPQSVSTTVTPPAATLPPPAPLEAQNASMPSYRGKVASLIFIAVFMLLFGLASPSIGFILGLFTATIIATVTGGELGMLVLLFLAGGSLLASFLLPLLLLRFIQRLASRWQVQLPSSVLLLLLFLLASFFWIAWGTLISPRLTQQAVNRYYEDGEYADSFSSAFQEANNQKVKNSDTLPLTVRLLSDSLKKTTLDDSLNGEDSNQFIYHYEIEINNTDTKNYYSLLNVGIEYLANVDEVFSDEEKALLLANPSFIESVYNENRVHIQSNQVQTQLRPGSNKFTGELYINKYNRTGAIEDTLMKQSQLLDTNVQLAVAISLANTEAEVNLSSEKETYTFSPQVAGWVDIFRELFGESE